MSLHHFVSLFLPPLSFLFPKSLCLPIYPHHLITKCPPHALRVLPPSSNFLLHHCLLLSTRPLLSLFLLHFFFVNLCAVTFTSQLLFHILPAASLFLSFLLEWLFRPSPSSYFCQVPLVPLIHHPFMLIIAGAKTLLNLISNHLFASWWTLLSLIQIFYGENR